MSFSYQVRNACYYIVIVSVLGGLCQEYCQKAKISTPWTAYQSQGVLGKQYSRLFTGSQGLLLGNAVDIAAAQDDLPGIYSHYLAIWEDFL